MERSFDPEAATQKWSNVIEGNGAPSNNDLFELTRDIMRLHSKNPDKPAWTITLRTPGKDNKRGDYIISRLNILKTEQQRIY